MQEIERVKAAVAKQKIPALSLWYGDERFLLEEAVKTLKKYYLERDPSGSGIETVSARQFSPQAIVDMANTMSFFAERLLIIEDIPYFQDGQSEGLEPYYKYFANPNPGTYLLFVSESIHRGRKFYKALAEAGEILEFTSPKKDYEWESWLSNELKARGKGMSQETIRMFLGWAGHQPGVLSQELDKLVVYTGERETIRPEDIKAVSPKAIESNVFDMVNAIAERRTGDAVRILREVLRDEHHLKVLTMIVRQFRFLLGAHAWRKRGGNGMEAASALGIKPYEAQKIWQQSLKLPEQTLIKGLEECLQVDVAMKSSKGDPAFLLEMMIVKFCQP